MKDNGFLSLNNAHCDLYSYHQRHDESLQSYYNTFKAKVEGLEQYGGSFGSNPGLVSAASMLKGAPVDKQDLLKLTKDHALAVLFLTHSVQTNQNME